MVANIHMFINTLVHYPLTETESSRINALRGALCFQVFCYHYYNIFLSPIKDEVWPAFRILEGQGYLSVIVFFALSGFLISLSYSKGISYKNPAPWKSFYIRRIFRIFPAWFIALISYFIFFRKTSILEFFWNFLFIFGFKSFQFSDLAAAHSWSLFVEELFYISFPLFVFIIRKRWVIYALALFMMLKEFAELAVAVEPGYFLASPLSYFQYFMVGIAAYIFLPYLRQAPIKRWFFYLCAAVVTCVTALYGHRTPLLWTYISFAFLYIFAAPAEVSKCFNFVFGRLGKYCYSFYLMHMLALYCAPQLIYWLLAPLEPLSRVEYMLSAFWIALVTNLLMTLILYHLVERPIILWSKRRFAYQP